MPIPITISKNVLETYRNGINTIPGWNQNLPLTLRELCLKEIGTHWKETPLFDEIPEEDDRCFLLGILPTNLPLSVSVPKIENDIYWKRCFLEKWPKEIANNGGVTWKQNFLQMFLRDYLEAIKPEDYQPEKIKELSDLCGEYVKKLELRELQCAEKSAFRIPLNPILSGLHLTELSICLKQKYVGEDFRWDTVSVAPRDVQLLCKGLEKCNLQTFRLTNSDIDDAKAVPVIKSLIKHDELKILELSHCKISDKTCIALSKLSLFVPLTELILTNNKIGPRGVQALCYALCKMECQVNVLNLKLNPLYNEAASYIMKPLTFGIKQIKKLFLNACRMSDVHGIGEMIESNSGLEVLDLSNNYLGEKIGQDILDHLKYNTTLVKLDIRMCKFNSRQEFEILTQIKQNKSSQCRIRKPTIIEPQYEFQIPPDLLEEIENCFTTTDEGMVK